MSPLDSIRKRLTTTIRPSRRCPRRRTFIARAQSQRTSSAIPKARRRTVRKPTLSKPSTEMFSVRIEVEPERHDALLAELWQAGTSGVIEGQGWVEAFFEGARNAEQFGAAVEAQDIDWVRATEDAWPPLLVGEKFFVVAPWRMEPTPPGRFRLEINPGQQCGTGQHPCTQLCLEAMERIIRPGDAVLD